MALESCITRQSLYVNPSANISGKQNELAGTPKKSDTGSNEAPTSPKTPTSPLVFFLAKDLFMKFIKVFMETTQAKTLKEPQERPLKARILETYKSKFDIECYNFYQ